MVAEDKRIYDQHAIKEYFDRNPDCNKVKSPFTKQDISKTFTPLPQVKNHLEHLLDSVHDPLANTWKEKHQEKKTFDDYKSKAERDCSLCLPIMKKLMIVCWEGNPELGIKKDYGLAFKMAEKLQERGDIEGNAYFGAMLCKGTGPTRDVTRGISYLGYATQMGSDIAAFYLAECYLDPPLKDLDINLEEALLHFEMSLHIALENPNYDRHMTDEQCALAKAKVAQLKRALTS